MLNNAVIMGRLTADPELKITNNGNNVTSFTVAVDRAFHRDQTDFINVVAWRQTAEFVTRYFHKGSMIAVQGSIQTRKYQDRNGNSRTAFEIVAYQVSFCGSKSESNTGNYNNNYGVQQQVRPAPQQSNYIPMNPQESVNPSQNVVDDWDTESEDDLPF